MFMKVLGGVAALLLAAAPAHAVLIDKTYTLIGTRFGQPAPVDPTMLTFSVRFDTTDADLDTPRPVTIRSYNIPAPTGMKFTYIKASDQLYICTSFIISTQCDQPTNTYNYNANWMVHKFSTGNIALFDGIMGYTYNDAKYYESNAMRVRDDGASGLGGGAGAVPEPASWALMILGFGGVGVALRRRTKPVAVA